MQSVQAERTFSRTGHKHSSFIILNRHILQYGESFHRPYRQGTGLNKAINVIANHKLSIISLGHNNFLCFEASGGMTVSWNLYSVLSNHFKISVLQLLYKNKTNLELPILLLIPEESGYRETLSTKIAGVYLTIIKGIN